MNIVDNNIQRIGSAAFRKYEVRCDNNLVADSAAMPSHYIFQKCYWAYGYCLDSHGGKQASFGLMEIMDSLPPFSASMSLLIVFCVLLSRPKYAL